MKIARMGETSELCADGMIGIKLLLGANAHQNKDCNSIPVQEISQPAEGHSQQK